MARRQESLFDSAYDAFLGVPWWVGPVVAGATLFIGLLVLPLVLPRPQPGQIDPGVILRPLIKGIVFIFGAIVLLAWMAAEITKFFQGRLLDRQTGLDSIRSLHWAEFEKLVAEAYRRQGYAVDHTGTGSGDGGVDLVLRRDRQVVLVQCKQWKAFQVGVRPVRELLGVVTSERAQRGIVITSGRFTAEAKRFAAGNPIELIDGPLLAQMIASVKRAMGPADASPTTLATSAVSVERDLTPSVSQVPVCPLCGKPMVARTARRGPNAGNEFWGCPGYPRCNGIRKMARIEAGT